jgi:Zn-dependent peptidase ImmA (M78 family)
MRTSKLQTVISKAKNLLQKSGFSEAPVDVERIATNLGVVVSRTPADDDISGFLFRQPDGSAIIGVNALHHSNRQRFTIAHEIGHFELHKFDQVHVDRSIIKLRSKVSSTGEDSEEIEANRFAAELLMPEEFLLKDLEESTVIDLNDERRMQQLAKKYQVSVQAMTNRLVSLGYLSV